MMLKEFSTRDVFYNNGIINLAGYLDKKKFKGIEYQLFEGKLVIKYPERLENDIFNEIFKGFISNSHIVHQTKNKRIYWDNNLKDFQQDFRYDVEGKSSGNDVKYLYDYISPDQLNMSSEQMYDIFKKFADREKLTEKQIDEVKKVYIESNENYKSESKCKIPVHMTQDEAINNYIKYCIKDEKIIFDSKIHQFEDGGYCFRDFLSNRDNYIDRWDALIYWFGVRIQRLYNSNYYIYINSYDLKALRDFKDELNINDDKRTIQDKDSGGIKPIPTNLNIYEQLVQDEITNSNFYISNSEEEFELKFLMYLFSHFYNLEDEYNNNTQKGKYIERLYSVLNKITFVSYTEDGNMKSSLKEYSKAYKVMQFFYLIRAAERDGSSLFKYFSDLLTSIAMSKPESVKVNLNIKNFCSNILNFRGLRENYYEAAFDILRNDKNSFGKHLYDFESIYLKFMNRGEKEMSLHDMSKIIGDEIGRFCGEIDDKDLLFKLRNIKNYNHMISYFKDLKFAALKKSNDARFTKNFDETLDKLFEVMEDDKSSYELIRDYIAIYAIDKYKATTYRKSMDKQGGK